MRNLGWMILILAVLLLSFQIVNRLQSEFLWISLDKNKQELLSSSTFSLVHRQVNSQWIEFSINRNMDAIRLLTNALVSEQAIKNKDDIWHYAIEYEFYDNNDKLLEHKVYYHRSRINWVINKDGKEISQTFFLDQKIFPTSSSEIIIQAKSYPDLSKVKVRLKVKDKAIEDVVFRLYQREEVDETRIDYIWQRMSPEERENVTRYSVYGSAFLRENELYQMLRFRWRPVGPNGIAHEDYETSKLYISQEEYVKPIEDKILPNLVDADKDLHHMVVIPENGGQIELKIKPIQNWQNDKTNEITINWYGRGRFKRETYKIDLTDAVNNNTNEENEVTWQKLLEGGLLEIQSSQAVVIRSWLTSRNIRKEITPLKTLISSYSLNTGQSLKYHIQHVDQQSTPVKIAVRSLMKDTENRDKPITITYRFISKNSIKKEGRFKLELTASYHDRLMNADISSQVSKAFKYYLNIPIPVDTLQLSADGPVFLKLYNRPMGYYFRQQIPESYFHQTEVQNIRPSWFSLKAENDLELIKQNRRVWIATQPETPVDMPVESLKDYIWEEYLPENSWKARYLLNPRKDDLPIKDSSLSVLFHLLEANKKQRLNFSAIQGMNMIEPTLIYIKNRRAGSKAKKENRPEKIKIQIDNNKAEDYYIQGTNGQIKLPIISRGIHSIIIAQKKHTAENTHWYINYSKGQKNYYIKRLSTYIDKKPVVYRIYKEKGEMVISGLVQSMYDEDKRALLRVKIIPETRAQQAKEFSVLRREYDIRPDNSQEIKVLNTRNQYVGKGQNFYFPLGNDIPEGEYQVEVELLKGKAIYLSLYHFDFGIKEDYKFYKMNVFDEKKQ